MKKTVTEYGTLHIGSKEALFDEAIALAERNRVDARRSELTWALTGGSTPAEFYHYSVSKRKIPQGLLEAACWFTSDERLVPLESDESNFGNAARMLLDPLGVAAERRFPWPVDREPREAARLFEETWRSRFSDFRCFDLCFLGMGDDCHTASIFPGSPLIVEIGDNFFAHVDVPGKGPRLTITQSGLEKCATIVVMVTGRKKAVAVGSVFHELFDPQQRPIQLLRNHAPRTVWLVDEEAASELMA